MKPRDILIDSSFLIALYNIKANEHHIVRETALVQRGRMFVPQVVLTETVYLIKRETGVRGAVSFLRAFAESNPDLVDVTVIDLQRAAEIMQQYSTASLDFVDCCIMALCERLDITQVGTLDRRDFSMFRPRHVDYGCA